VMIWRSKGERERKKEKGNGKRKKREKGREYERKILPHMST